MSSKPNPDTRDKDQPERRAVPRTRPAPQSSSPSLNLGLELIRDSHC